MKASRTRISPAMFTLAVAFLVCGGGTAHSQPGFSGEGANACLDCHETPYVMGILETAHAKVSDPKTPAARRECQSCHGPSEKHMKFPMQVENVHFGEKSTTAPKEQNLACLECHDDGNREQWHGSAHGFENVVCSTCHGIHDPERVMPSKSATTNGCTDGCHEDLMADSKPSDFTHSIGQDLGDKGQLACFGCHNPHGPLSSERCIECHLRTDEDLAKESEKARRFHAVATEKGTDCIRCHKGIAHPIPPLALEQSEAEQRELMAE